ncbi:PHB depolymerase family esterase [Colwellia psychrerythraea]|uniref:Esterase, PHB depolymerase family n=1 Tax=Colwellia psychrerythraea TaxID=28229 RepID=A0A099KS37_COLPS|nr:PHB depolymerase family esterase [Colwellia psychrerythraea]KGJ93356.1 esterase, PHB depolymerase family [Colwellia psychrerythraea]
MKKLLSIGIKQITTLFTLLLILPLNVYAGSWQQNVSIGGFNKVHIYTPDSTSPIGDGQSLLIVLHGCVQPIDNFLTANLENAAEASGMVIAVPDAMNKAGYSCWSYWQGSISRTSGDYKNLINLANTMSADALRNIDAKQIYLAGLSSGAAMSAQTACLAPDIFAGVAPSAGPTIGTSSNGAITTCETVSSTTFKSRCESYAGSAKNHFSTQIAAIGHGTADTTVNTCYNQQNADGFANVYGVTKIAGNNTVTEGVGHSASETLWTDNRIAMLWFDNLDHSWSGGIGASGDYVADSSINFARYLGKFFADNNKRVDRNAGPVISNYNVTVQSSQLSISGNAIDNEGSVDNVNISIYAVDSSNPILIETLNTQVNVTDGSYSATSTTLADGLYQITAIATDSEAKAGDNVSVTIRVGPEPPATAPILSNTQVFVAGQCATVTGSVIDINQNLASVVVSFVNGDINATVSQNIFTAEQCNLLGGQQNATITATDTSTLSSSGNISFIIDTGVSGDYNLHINAGHITWGEGYSACYLAFSTDDFIMREYPAGTNQCQWISDTEPSCAGPNQSCVVNNNDADNDTIIDSADNCPNISNVDQADNDNDGLGNVCDATPNGDSPDGESDMDNDGIIDSVDNCPNISNNNQADNDNDGLGNVCDSTPDGDNPDPIFTCQQFTSSNYAHVQANRATTNGFYAYAVGSGETLGLYNIFYSATLAQTAESFFSVGTCP